MSCHKYPSPTAGSVTELGTKGAAALLAGAGAELLAPIQLRILLFFTKKQLG